MYSALAFLIMFSATFESRISNSFHAKMTSAFNSFIFSGVFSKSCRNRGIGAGLVRRAVAEARRLGHGAVILVGDAPYYGRFGFSVEKTGRLRLPGPFERHRLLALELKPGALDGARGLIRAAGRAIEQPAAAAA